MAITTTTLPRWAFPAMSIDTWSAYSAAGAMAAGPGTNVAWPTANKIIYTPLLVKSRVIAVKLWFASGITGTDNCAVGVYDRAGTRIANSGTIAKTASYDETVSNITDVSIGPGLYYMALQCVSATATFRLSSVSAPVAAAQGVRTETAGGIGLPTTATWVVDSTLTVVPLCGMFLEATPV